MRDNETMRDSEIMQPPFLGVSSWAEHEQSVAAVALDYYWQWQPISASSKCF